IFAAGSHSLQTFLAEIARDVVDPKTGKTSLDVWLSRRQAGLALQSVPGAPVSSPVADTASRTKSSGGGDLRLDTLFTIDALGSGSDYTAFLDHVGVPSMHVNYGGEGNSGIYHSIYDSYDFYRRFLDTTFVYGVTEARTNAMVLTRLADAVVLPFEFGN